MNRLNLLSLITLLCSLTALGAPPRFTLEYQPETDLGNTQGFTIADFTVDEAESAPYHYSMKVSPSWRTRFRINRRNDSGGSDRNYGPVNDDEKLLRSDKEIAQLTGGDYFLFLGEKGEVNISFDVDASNTITNFKITGITPHTPKLFLSASDNNWETETLNWTPVEGSDRKWTASYSRHMANGAIFGFKPMIYGWQNNKSAPSGIKKMAIGTVVVLSTPTSAPPT